MAGRGRDNRLVIPVCGAMGYLHYECLRGYRSTARSIGNGSITFVVETTRPGSRHACTVDDVVRVLEHVPAEDLEEIDLVVMRQPTRKEWILESVWGRLAFYVEIGRHKGCAIVLDSVEADSVLRWSKSLGPDQVEEIDRLRADGHEITATRRHHEIRMSSESVRATQLYRTLPHEIGHYVDFMRDPDAFDTKPSADKERFAHAYARDMRARLEAAGVIPFPRIVDAASMERDGLAASDFASE